MSGIHQPNEYHPSDISYPSDISMAVGIWRYMPGSTSTTPFTSIRISTELRDELSELKVHPEESCGDVIKRLVEMCIDDEPLSDTTIQAIDESMADIRAGRVYSLEDVAEELCLHWSGIYGSGTHSG